MSFFHVDLKCLRSIRFRIFFNLQRKRNYLQSVTNTLAAPPKKRGKKKREKLRRNEPTANALKAIPMLNFSGI